MKVGDFVIKKSNPQIAQSLFDSSWPQGIFGKIIVKESRFCTHTGKRLPVIYTIRCYMKSKKYHSKVTAKQITKI